MSLHTRIALLFPVVLLAVAAWASAQSPASRQGTARPEIFSQDVRPVVVDPPIVLSGSDVGFRISARKGDTPVGTLVVRVNGQWVEAQVGNLRLLH
jgi:hypothetical protein